MRKTLLWLVISAAFIGPGTVTATTNAGAQYGASLLWTIVFAVVACIVLQEGAARINIASNLSLGEAIIIQFRATKKRFSLALMLTIAVILGCAAYEAGNILGAIAGISITTAINSKLATVVIVVIAAVLLYSNRFNLITNVLATIIGVMGLSLLVVVFTLDLNTVEVAKGLFIPRFPAGSELLVLGLIGTTVVPYNLFLGSKLATSQELKSMRRGLGLSVILGGLISISLILIGSKVTGEYSFANVASTLANATGSWATYFFAFGLFAAGLTSAITAPWAASITFTSTIKTKSPNKAFHAVWIIVLLTGLIFGITDVKPIPIIILAQAVNGILLPFLAATILLVLNNNSVMKAYTNKWLGNIILMLILWITGILGLINLTKAFYATFGIESAISTTTLVILAAISLLFTILVAIKALNQSKTG
ncbi:MAG: Nramp family divalent metal transporter [Bacteroidota bacterium]